MTQILCCSCRALKCELWLLLDQIWEEKAPISSRYTYVCLLALFPYSAHVHVYMTFEPVKQRRFVHYIFAYQYWWSSILYVGPYKHSCRLPWFVSWLRLVHLYQLHQPHWACWMLCTHGERGERSLWIRVWISVCALRMGASDRIFSGKSTFMVELTVSVRKYNTSAYWANTPLTDTPFYCTRSPH